MATGAGFSAVQVSKMGKGLEEITVIVFNLSISLGTSIIHIFVI